MGWWMIPVGLQLASTVLNTSSANRQNNDQLTANQFNAQTGYDTALDNIQMQMRLGSMNAAMTAGVAGIKNRLIDSDTDFNVNMIAATTAYNDLLLEDEIEQIWEASDLDLEMLRMMRARERGTIVADQAASGTIIGTGSNADVVIDQKTMEALDSFVIRRNADVAVTDIENQRMQSLWTGDQQIKKTIWEGSLNKYGNAISAAFQSASILTSTAISGLAGLTSAENKLSADWQSSYMKHDQNQNTISNNFRTGLFGAAAAGVSGYYASLNPGSSLMVPDRVSVPGGMGGV